MNVRGPLAAECVGPLGVCFLRFEVAGAPVWVQAIPTPRALFDLFACAVPGFDNAWYEASQIEPATESRVPWRVATRSASREDYEGVFVGGLDASEAAQFAGWLDPRGELPDLALWRALYEHARHLPPTLAEMCAATGSEDAALIRRLETILRPQTLAEAMLMTGGMLEWVTCRTWRGATWRLVGQPRQELYAHAFDPVAHPVQPVAGQRIRAAGVRAVLSQGA